MSDGPTVTRPRTYRRLLGYVRPYRWVLVVGLLAGALSGGSVVGLLTSLPGVLGALTGKPEQTCRVCRAAKVCPVCGDTKPNVCPHCGAAKPKVCPNCGANQPGLPLGLDRIGWVRQLTDRLGTAAESLKGGPLTGGVLLISIAVLLGFYLLKEGASFLNRYCTRWVGVQAIKDLRNTLYGHLLRQSLRFYSRSDVGHLISRVNNDAAAIDHAVSTTLADLTQAPFQIAGVLTAVAYVTVRNHNYVLPIAMFVIMPLAIMPLVYLTRRVKHHFRSSLQRIGELNSRMHETFTGIRIVKAFSMEQSERDRFAAVNRKYSRQLLRALLAELMMAWVLSGVNVLLACALAFAAYLQGIGFEQLGTMAVAGLMAYEPIKRLARINTEIQRSSAAGERIFDFLDTDTELRDAASPQVLTGFRDRIVYEHVDFAYDANAPVLKDICLEIPKGKVVALVGQAGSGKSTVANLLARFYDPDRGRVTLDGTDLRDVAAASLRGLIGIVTQDTILFNDTIANNIAYGSGPADRERLVAAATRANAHGFIMERDTGYETVVGEKGFVLSGGQKQRLAIARALYRNPQILILDEATSALDTMTERLVQEALLELMKDRTVLAIAHRLSTIRYAYRICVLEEGRIVEQGTHAELLALDGRYKRMTEMQTLR